MFLQATKALSTVAMPELCGVLRLSAHPCQLQDFLRICFSATVSGVFKVLASRARDIRARLHGPGLSHHPMSPHQATYAPSTSRLAMFMLCNVAESAPSHLAILESTDDEMSSQPLPSHGPSVRTLCCC
jgi:hypothetical protein